MKEDRVYLEHIRQAIGKITEFSAVDRERFLQDPMIQDAVIRNFEIIGEAAKRLSDTVKLRSPKIPWRRVAGFRDILIHDYMGVDIEEVWNIIQTQLPALRREVDQLLKP